MKSMSQMCLIALTFFAFSASAQARQLKAGNYRLGNGDIYYANGNGAVCLYTDMNSYRALGQVDGHWTQVNRLPNNVRYEGICTGRTSSGAVLRAGNYLLNNGDIYYSNGRGAVCLYKI